MLNEITFYRSNEKPYGCFSNIFRREINFEGRSFPTAEHAYQYGKPRKQQVRDWLMDAPSPSLLAMSAHGLYSWDIVPGWSKNKVARMREVILAKFTQHDDLKQILVDTGKSRIVEVGTVDNPVNRFWGEVNGVGKNMLGLILMSVRVELRDEPRGEG